jgi:hypothetical protein
MSEYRYSLTLMDRIGYRTQPPLLLLYEYVPGTVAVQINNPHSLKLPIHLFTITVHTPDF